MKINPRTLLFAAVAAESSGLGKAAGAAPSPATTPPPAADSASPKREMTPSDLEARLTPEARKVLQDRQARKAGKATDTNPATTPPPAASEAAAAVVPPPKAPENPEGAAKPGDDVKTDDAPEGVIDFTKLKPEPPAGEDGAPAPLTEAELADLAIVRKKLEEAHKDNASQRKLKRELKEAKEKLEAENKSLTEELASVRAQTADTKSTGSSYLARFTDVKDVEAAKADALETLRQLQEQPDRETIHLPGRAPWKITDGEGKSFAAGIAQTAFEILEGSDGRIAQLTERTAAETVVKDHLPKLAKALPDFEKSYQEMLKSDWTARAPEISLDAALGKLVRTGAYVMVPAGKQAAVSAPKPKAEPKPELPNTPPPVREAKAGEADLSALKKRAFEGDQKALAEWIKRGGKRSQAA